MKAIVYTQYGGPDQLEVKEIEKPSPADNEVLIRVHAVSINEWDWALLHGTPFINRMLFGLLKPRKHVLGSDVAGTVEAVGKAITRLKVGDHVFGDLSERWGGFAEYVCAPESSLALKPARMSFEQAAAIPQAAMLAVQALIDTAKIQPGQKILINGAGGGVGIFAIQIAKAHGTEVTAVDSAMKLDMMRGLGADHVIDYKKVDFTKSGKRYDVILDVKTNRSVMDHARALLPGGIFVTVGGSLGRLFQALLFMPWVSLIRKKRLRVVALKLNKDLLYMAQLFEAGKVTPVIDGPYKLDDAREAFMKFERAEHKGKIVFTV